jgi:rRNA biogenesis protein RRP5
VTDAPPLVAEPLDISAGFRWDGQDAEGASSAESDDDDAESETSEPSPKRGKADGGFVDDRTGDMATDAPTSATDFERLLLGSPDSSFLWIQYMSYHIQLSEIATAREIAQRALNTIGFREEGEKLNIWVAILNLENAYGSDESLDEAFKEAAQRNEPKTIHLKLADIFEQTGKFEVRGYFLSVSKPWAHKLTIWGGWGFDSQKAEELYQRTVKKFSQSSKVWVLFGQYYLNRNKAAESRELLPRSLKSLPKRKRASSGIECILFLFCSR